MAEQEMITRATTAKVIQIDLIHRDFEGLGIAQRCTAIRELSVTSGRHDRADE